MKKLLIIIATALTLLAFTAFCSNAETKAETVYKDVKNTDWYASASVYSFEQGYMSGTANAVFSPQSNVTRGMFVTILSKMNNADISSYSKNKTFRDVTADKWYHNAVEWAYANGYAKGTGNGVFSPDTAVSRQDLSVMLYTYAKKNTKGDPYVNYVSVQGYSDYNQIAAYALESVRWAVGNGFISGTSSTTLSPKSTATRAMISVIIRNYDKVFGHNWVENEEISPKSCTKDVLKSYTCQKCGSTKTVTTKAWHVWNNGVSKTPATCTTSGTTLYTCKACGGTYTGQTNALGHDWKNCTITYTSSASGCVATYHCNRNYNHTYSKTLSGHNYVNNICTRCGFEKGYNKVCVNGVYFLIPQTPLYASQQYDWYGRTYITNLYITYDDTYGSYSRFYVNYDAQKIGGESGHGISFHYSLYDSEGYTMASSIEYSDNDVAPNGKIRGESFYFYFQHVSGDLKKGKTYKLVID